MSALGCRECRNGWLGYNLAGQLVACPSCRPHVREYLRRHDRDHGTTVIPNLPLSEPEIAMPDWFRSTAQRYRAIARRARETAAAEGEPP